MSDETTAQIWSVEVAGQIYESTLDELIQWIAEGALLPADKVRRGNLRWIEAGKVPPLMPHFSAKSASGVQPSRVDALINEAGLEKRPAQPYIHHSAGTAAVNISNGNCHRHPDSYATVVCVDCALGFCPMCPSSYGSVKICPECGGMCKSKMELQQTAIQNVQFQTDLAEGFGFQDLIRAIGHPFRFRSSLFFGALMFAFFTFGQSASALGGIFMFCASLTCMMMANMLTFGVLANTVDNFSQGKIDSNFMPEFDEFSLWDDVVHPFFLSIGAYLTSFGPFLLILVIGMYFVFSSIATKTESIKTEIERIPGSHYYDTQRTVQQSEKVKDLLGTVEEQNAERMKRLEELENGKEHIGNSGPEDTEMNVQRANEMIQQNRKQQLESVIGKTKADRQEETTQMIRSFLSLAAPLVVFAAIAFLWGVFYFPAACAVAGYTRSFFATINPMVGLDTIRRLGFDYVKLLGMCFLIVVASGFIGMILGAILSPLDLPGFGNLPVRAIMSLFSFYFFIVFSCVLGLALYKNSDRLKLLR